MPHRKEKQRLVGIGKDHLLDVLGVAGQSGQDTMPGLHGLDLPFPLAHVDGPHPIADSDQIGAPALALERPLQRRKQDPGFVAQMDIEELPVGADHQSRQRRRRGRRRSSPGPRRRRIRDRSRRQAASRPLRARVRTTAFRFDIDPPVNGQTARLRIPLRRVYSRALPATTPDVRHAPRVAYGSLSPTGRDDKIVIRDPPEPPVQARDVDSPRPGIRQPRSRRDGYRSPDRTFDPGGRLCGRRDREATRPARHAQRAGGLRRTAVAGAPRFAPAAHRGTRGGRAPAADRLQPGTARSGR